MKQSNTSLKDTAWLANRLGLSISTVERLRARDRDDIPTHVTIGRSIRYDEATVEQWLAERLQSHEVKEVSHVA